MKIVMPLNARKTKKSFPGNRNKKRVKVDFAAKGDDDDNDDDISSDSSVDDNRHHDDTESEEEEPLQVKKVRMAREYLAAVDAADTSDEEDSEEDDEDDIRGDALSRRLQKQRQIQQGTYRRKIASSVGSMISDFQKLVQQQEGYDGLSNITNNDTKQLGQLWIESTDAIRYLRPFQTHKLAPTCVAVSNEEKSTNKAVSGAKDHSVVLWDMATEQRVSFLTPRYKSGDTNVDRTNGQVWSVAMAGDLVASGTRSGLVRLFDVRQQEQVHSFSQAKAGITALEFTTDDQQLLAASMDRCIRVYQTPERLLVETLYGHQAPVHDLTTAPQYPVSVGADRTSRVWKMDTDSHLILRCNTAPADCLTGLAVSKDTFASGHADGTIQTWHMRRKQAVNRMEHAHRSGIISMASVQDLLASGSQDGWLQFYQCNETEKKGDEMLTVLGRLPVHGCINQIAMTEKFLLAAVGQDHKWGRWERSVGAKNRIVMVPLVKSSTSQNSNEGAA